MRFSSTPPTLTLAGRSAFEMSGAPINPQSAPIYRDGYRQIRQSLADQYNIGSHEPDIQVYNVNREGDRTLTLRHIQHNRQPLHKNTDEVVKHIGRLWGFNVKLETVDEKNKIIHTHECKTEL